MASQLAEIRSGGPVSVGSDNRADAAPNAAAASASADYLPDEILFALTQPPQQQQQPAGCLASLPKGRSVPKPSNVWNFPKRRQRLKHLTESTVCVCGAGDDISFLYDVPKPVNLAEKSPSATELQLDQQQQQQRQRQRRKKQAADDAESSLPDTLQPDEFQLVRHKGSVGLQISPNEHTTQAVDHDKHLVMFPSLKPTSRWEVLQLSKTFNKLLDSVSDFNNEQPAGTTQMHKLLELSKIEQDMFNVAFHELIRQSTVQCVERGELLANIREKYRAIIADVPFKMKQLHDEVMAQRALDRRLTEELLRFKTRIGGLSSELSGVKRHELAVVSGSRATQQELRQALAEAKRSADLLEEYHGLYELQRKRLESQVEELTAERQLWCSTAYGVALCVAEETGTQVSLLLHDKEQQWLQLAQHYSQLLAEKDKEDVRRVQQLVDAWRDKAEAFAAQLRERDAACGRGLGALKGQILEMKANFEDSYLDESGSRLQQTLSTSDTKSMLAQLQSCESALNREASIFVGDVMLDSQETLASMRRLLLTWNDLAATMFARHRAEDGSDFPEKKTMPIVTATVQTLSKQFSIRLTGENGVARGIITLQNILETWITRLQSSLNSGKLLPEQEWLRFHLILDDWVAIVDEAEASVGSCLREDAPAAEQPPALDPNLVAAEVAKWASKVAGGVESDDTRIAESIVQLHTSALRWLIQSLLRLAPDLPGNSREAQQAALTASATPQELMDSYTEIGQWITKFTVYLSDSCSVIVNTIVSQRLAMKDEDFDRELNELLRFKAEALGWCTAAGQVLQQLGFDAKELPDPTLAANIGRDPRLPTQSSIVTAGTAQLEDSLLQLVAREETAEAEEEEEEEEQREVAVEEEKDSDVKDQLVTGNGLEENGKREEEEEEQKEVEKERLMSGGEGQAFVDENYDTAAAQAETEAAAAAAAAEEAVEETVEGIGPDLNVHSRQLSQSADTQPQDVVAMESGVRAATPDGGAAFAALGSMQQLQKELLLAETEAAAADEAEAESRLEMEAVLQQQTVLKEKLESLQRELEEARRPPTPPPKKPELLQH